MKLLCISASAADAKEDQEEDENSTNQRVRQKQANSEQPNATNTHHQQSQPTKLRSWYDSLRRGLKGGRRGRGEQRVTISDPISSVQLTQSELIQINGVIEVKPADQQQASNGAEKSADNQQGQISSTTATVATSEADKQEDTVDHGGNSSSPVPSSSVDPQDKENHDQVEGDDASEEEEESSEETCQTLVSYPWFWGGISRRDAEALLRGRKDGTFLVRDSSDRPRYLYSLSFRSNGKTMHTRIEQSAGRLYFSSSSSSSEATPTRNGAAHKSKREDGSGSLGGLIAVAMNQNNGTDSIFFYSRAGQLRTAAAEDNQLEQQAVSTASLHTVQLNTPLSRFAYLLDFEYSSSAADEADQKKALQYLCKFVLHHVPQARATIEECGDNHGQLATLPVELQRFATSSEYFPRPVKVA